MSSEQSELFVYGKVLGNVRARVRVEIPKDGSITGDIACARISIEDGAHFKGRIEINLARSKTADDYIACPHMIPNGKYRYGSSCFVGTDGREAPRYGGSDRTNTLANGVLVLQYHI